MYDLITILGPTACGKTRFAADLAGELKSEIISADSRQVYRRMDIGTGKDLSDYYADGKPIPYYLIDICEPGTEYNLFRYQKDFHHVYAEMKERNILPILCGGSGLYIESVLKGYHLLDVPENKDLRERLKGKTLPELAELLASYRQLHNKTDIDTPNRAIRAIEIEEYYCTKDPEMYTYKSLESLIIGISISREERRVRISSRLKERLKQGMIDEVDSLLKSGVSPESLIRYGLEYRYVTLYLKGKLLYEEMFSKLETAIHQFAKRQMTWFRGMERKGFKIHWIDSESTLSDKIAYVKTLLSQ